MDDFAGQSSGNLEDQLRRMILAGSPAHDQAATPRVRLPPPIQQPMQQLQGSQQYRPLPSDDRQNRTTDLGPGLSHTRANPSLPTTAYQSPLPNQASHQLPQFHQLHQGNQRQHPEPRGSLQYRSHPSSQVQQPVHLTAGPTGSGRGRGAQRQQRQQHVHLDPDAFRRNGPNPNDNRRPPPHHMRNLYDPDARTAAPLPRLQPEYHMRRAEHLDQIANVELGNVQMSEEEYHEKESFRQVLERLCHEVSQDNPELPSCSLECFGSFKSGFASAGSDMDLVIVVRDGSAQEAVFSMMDSDLPRVLESKLLQAGHGARLLTRTRVPIIKICQAPSESLLDKLRAEREKWDFLPNEQKYPHLHPEHENKDGVDDNVGLAVDATQSQDVQNISTADYEGTADAVGLADDAIDSADKDEDPLREQEASGLTSEEPIANQQGPHDAATAKQEPMKIWTRERKGGPLDFPKEGVGIQCDINFFNPLGLHNTQLLRCYSLCDNRVRPMVLFVKSWAKLRGINSSYSGTLSSYGYVLMVLHYLVNIAQPPVLTNLQAPWRPHPDCTPPSAAAEMVDGWNVDFWRNEAEIIVARENGQLSPNQEPVGSLLAGFFEYYASQGSRPQFNWTRWVLSLRTPGGIMSKDEKGWVKASTEETDGKRIQHRYLFCIEDPFELSHNVARTVTHNGIVAIRDEFRRVSRILHAVGQGQQPTDGHLLAKLEDGDELVERTKQLKTSNRSAHNMGTVTEKSTPPIGPDGSQPMSHARPPQQRVGSSRTNEARPLPRPKAKTLNTADQEDFPSLGAASSKKVKSSKQSGEISGEKARVYLEEFRRKKAEEQAEYTATGAAESVLDGDD